MYKNIPIFRDKEVIAEIANDIVKVQWSATEKNANKDYKSLLRFDVYVKNQKENNWIKLKDASCHTNIAICAPDEILQKALYKILTSYTEAIRGNINKQGDISVSVKHLGKVLSQMLPDDF